MKKNYISRLKQYDAKTSLKDKQRLYTKKFIKTCYTLNKQNEDPNISDRKNQSHSKQSNKKIKALQSNQTKSSEMKKSTLQDERVEQKQVSQFKEININPYECEFNSNHSSNVLYVAQDNSKKVICCEECSMKYLNKTLFFDKESSNSSSISERKWAVLANIKLQCVQIQRFFRQKQAQQTQKCNNYYQALYQQLKNQQESTLSCISASFHHNYDLITQKMGQIQIIIGKLDESLFDNLQSSRYCSYLPSQDTQIDACMLAINMNDDILLKARLQLSKFDLKNLGFLATPHVQIAKAVHSLQNQSCMRQKLNEQSLTCQQEFIDPKTTKIIKNQLDISFEQNEDFIIGGDCPIIEDSQSQTCGISPSFKYF